MQAPKLIRYLFCRMYLVFRLNNLKFLLVCTMVLCFTEMTLKYTVLSFHFSPFHSSTGNFLVVSIYLGFPLLSMFYETFWTFLCHVELSRKLCRYCVLRYLDIK